MGKQRIIVMPSELVDAVLAERSAAPCKVLLALYSDARLWPGQGASFSQRALAQTTGLSRRTVARSLDLLIQFGAIRRSQTGHETALFERPGKGTLFPGALVPQPNGDSGDHQRKSGVDAPPLGAPQRHDGSEMRHSSGWKDQDQDQDKNPPPPTSRSSMETGEEIFDQHEEDLILELLPAGEEAVIGASTGAGHAPQGLEAALRLIPVPMSVTEREALGLLWMRSNEALKAAISAAHRKTINWETSPVKWLEKAFELELRTLERRTRAKTETKTAPGGCAGNELGAARSTQRSNDSDREKWTRIKPISG